jgi:hypothetical protein
MSVNYCKKHNPHEVYPVCPGCAVIEIARMKERLSFRGKVTAGVFCDGCSSWEQMAWEATAEIARLTKEVERLDKAFNAALKQRNDLFTENAALREKVERAKDALREIREIYAGMDGFIPETAPEGYQQRIIKQMYDAAVRALDEAMI